MSSSRRITPPGGSAIMPIHSDENSRENSRGNNSRLSRTSNRSDRLPSRGRSLLRSRSPGIIHNLFGRRSRRSRGSEDQLPTEDEIFFGPSVPTHVRNGNGWENVHPSAYGEYSYMVPETAGAPYALSNIPAQIYIMQPQQAPVSLPGTETTTGPLPRFPSNSQSMAISSMGATQPVPGTVYTAVYLPSMPSGGPATARMPMMPIPTTTNRPESVDTEATDRRRMSSTHAANDRSDGSPQPSRQRKYGHRCHISSPLSKSPSRGYRRDHRHQESTSKKMQRRHICNGCGRVRSRKFHDANPIRPGKKSIPNYCRKCREVSRLADNVQEWEDDNEDEHIALEEKNWHLPSETSYGGSVLSPAYPRPVSVASTIPEDGAAEMSVKATKEEEHSALCPDNEMSSATGCISGVKPQASKSKNNKAAHGYQNPTVESVVDTSEKHNGTLKVNGANATGSKTEAASPKVQGATDEESCGREALTSEALSALDALDETDDMEHAEALKTQSHDHAKTADQADSPFSQHISCPVDGNNHSDKSTIHGDPVKAPLSPCPVQSPSVDHRKSTFEPLCGHCHYHSTCVSAHQSCQLCHRDEYGRAFDCGHSQACHSAHCNNMFSANGCGHRSDAPAGMPCQGRHASEQVHVPRTFSVHTVSPTIVSEHLQKEMDTPASPIEPGGDRDDELDAWLSGKTMFPDDYDATMPVSDDCTEYGEDYQTSGVVPPYNFDLFSDRAHSRGSSPSPSFSYPQDVYDGQTMGRNRRRGSIGSISSVNSGDSNDDGLGAVVPEYNFDLFSDVADRWNAYEDSDSSSNYHAAGYGGATVLEDKTNRKGNMNRRTYSSAAYAFGGGEKENMDVTSECGSTVSAIRRALAARMSSRVSFEIKECEDDDNIDSLGKKVRHIVDCEVISNPDSTSECGRTKWSSRTRVNGSQMSPYESLIR